MRRREYKEKFVIAVGARRSDWVFSQFSFGESFLRMLSDLRKVNSALNATSRECGYMQKRLQ